VVVKRWDAGAELLVDVADEEEAGRYASGVRRFEFDSQLAPYDFGRVATWRALTDAITPADLQRLTPARLRTLCLQ